MSSNGSYKLIEIALRQIGNETLTEDCYEWLPNILSRLYEDHSWPFLEKLSTGTIGASVATKALPADFDELFDVNSLKLIDQESGAEIPLIPIMAFDHDMLINPSQTGTPKNVLLDLAAMEWTPFPLANKTYGYSLRYKYKPDRPVDITANYTPVWPNDQILIQAIKVQAFEHEDDDRMEKNLMILKSMIADYKAKFNRQPQKNKQARFGPSFKKIPVMR